MRTDVKLGLAVALVLTVAAGWYFSRSDAPATQVPLSGSDGVLSLGGTDTSTPPAPRTSPSRGNRTNSSAERPAPTEAGRPPSSNPSRPVTAPSSAQSSPPASVPRGEPVDSRMASATPAERAGGGSAPAPTDGPRRSGDAASTPTNDRPSPPAGSSLPIVGTERPKASTEVHTAKAGDTFEQLAQVYYGDARYAGAIRNANPSLGQDRSLPGGASVVIPDVQPLPALPRSQPERSASPVPTVRDGSSPARGVVPVATNATAPATPASMKIYSVREGDSLYAIARSELSAGTRWKEIYELNKAIIGSDPAQLKVGQVLKIPAR